MTNQEIVEQRTQHGLSRAKLAKKAGMSEFTVWRLENGHKVSESFRKKVIDVLTSLNSKKKVEPVLESPTRITIKGSLLNPFDREQLVKLREALGLNQYQMSKKLQISPATLSMWESGRNRPSLTSIANLRKFFKPYVTIETEVVEEPVAQVETTTETPSIASAPIKRVVTSISQMALVLAFNLKPYKFYGVDYVGEKCVVVAVDHNYRVLNLRTMKWLPFFEANSLERIAHLVENTSECQMIQAETVEDLRTWLAE